MTTTPVSGPGQVPPRDAPAVFPSADTWQPWAAERGLRCINCQRTYALREVIYRCPPATTCWTWSTPGRSTIWTP